MGEAGAGVVTVAQVWGLFQVFLRVAALFSVAPVFGAREVAPQVRVGLALVLSLTIYPLVARFVAGPPADLWDLAAAALAETIIGLLMGLVVSLLFQAVLVAGDLMDLQIGFGMAAVFNPSLGTQAAMLGQFLHRYTIVVFLLLNGHHLLLTGIVTSFSHLPASHLTLQTSALALAGNLAGTVMIAGLRIAAPAVATLLIVDVALALVSRAVPQMNVFVVGMPLKIVVGLVVIVAALGLITTVLQNYVTGVTPEMLHTLRALHGLRAAGGR